MSKVSWKYIFCGISINSFRKQTYSYEKKVVLHTTTPIHCEAKHGLHDLFSTNQGSGSE